MDGFVDNWLRLNVQTFERNDKTFAALVQSNNGQETRQVISEFASLKCGLEINADFNQISIAVIKKCKTNLKQKYR